MKNTNQWILGFAAAFALNVSAAPSPTDTATMEMENETPIEDALKSVAPGQSQGFTGLIDMRPSVTPSSNGFHTENALELGYRFTPNFKMAFQQWVNTHEEDTSKPDQSLNPVLTGGFLRATFSNVWKSGNWALNYEPRLYIPETSADFDSKRMVSMRNYLMLSNQVASFCKVTFMEIPVLHWYEARGYSSNGKLKGNQYFENRFYINTDFTVGKFTLSVPILFISSSILDYASTPGGWKHSLLLWPELAYSISSNVDLGIALRTDSLISPTFNKLTLFDEGTGFSASVAQMVLRATL